jgi:hypothetical protein
MATATSLRTRTVPAIATLAILLITGAAPAAARVAPENTVSPTISGTPRVGQTLSASQGEWQGSPTSFFYQWLRCDRSGASCSAIAGAVEPTYRLTPAEIGSRIRVEVVAENADGDSPAARSAATNVIRIPVPTSTAKPQVSGVAREGQTLSTTTGTWTGSPDAFAYQWKRCAASQCVAIPGATASTYVLSAAEVGTRVRVQVTATNDGGKRSAQSTSTPTVRSSTAGFKLGQPKHDRKRGLARLRVTVPSSGVLTLERTAKVRPDQRHAFGAGTLKLTVKPRQRARHRLHRRGQVRVRVKVSFAPDAGTPIFRDRRITLKSR